MDIALTLWQDHQVLTWWPHVDVELQESSDAMILHLPLQPLVVPLYARQF